MTTDLSTLTPGQRAHIASRTEQLLAFAKLPRAKAVPAKLRHRLTKKAFLAMNVAEREAHIRERAPELVLDELAERRERHEQRRREAEEDRHIAASLAATIASASDVPSSAPAEVARPSRYVVACADGCGKTVRARSYRPVVAYVKGHRPAPPKPRKRDEDY